MKKNEFNLRNILLQWSGNDDKFWLKNNHNIDKNDLEKYQRCFRKAIAVFLKRFTVHLAFVKRKFEISQAIIEGSQKILRALKGYPNNKQTPFLWI